MEDKQLEEHIAELGFLMRLLRIFDGIAWSFNQAKCWRWWRNVFFSF